MMTTVQSAAEIGLPVPASTYAAAVLRFRAATLQHKAALQFAGVANTSEEEAQADAAISSTWRELVWAMRDLTGRRPASVAEAAYGASAVSAYFDDADLVEPDNEFCDAEMTLFGSIIRNCAKVGLPAAA